MQVLASCLRGAGLARCLRAGVTADSFATPHHKEIWACLQRLHAAGQPLSLDVITEDLRAQRLLESIGPEYLRQIANPCQYIGDQFPNDSEADAKYFLAQLLEKERLRAVVAAARAAEAAAYAYTGGGLDVYEPLVRAAEVFDRVRSQGGRELPPVLGFREFVKPEPSPLPEELVAGVLHRGAKMMIAGGSKSFKTWVLLDLALSVSTGSPWWGKRTVAGRVLYLNLELMQPFCEARVRSVMEAKKITEAEGLDTWHLRGQARDFTDLLPHLLAQATAVKYALIILDPIYKVLGERDENANGEVAELLNAFEALAVRTGAAIAYGHHHSKGNQAAKDARDRSSGAGAWTRDPDALIDLTPHEEEDHFTVTYTLRNHPPRKPVVVEWKFPCFIVSPGLDPAALKKPGPGKSHLVEDVVALLDADPAGFTYSQWERAAKNKGISESTFKRLRREADDKGLVRSVGGVYTRGGQVGPS